MRRSGFKAKARKTSAIRQSAKNEDCTIRLPGVCNWNPETTVLCHENGAGMGMKSPDECGAYGCYCCHMVLDRQTPLPDWLSYDDVLLAFAKGNERTREILKRKGLL